MRWPWSRSSVAGWSSPVATDSAGHRADHRRDRGFGRGGSARAASTSSEGSRPSSPACSRSSFARRPGIGTVTARLEPGPTTQDLLASARATLPGGGIWTFSQRPAGFGSSLDAPEFLIDRAAGAYVLDDGRRRGCWTWSSGRAASSSAMPIRRSLRRSRSRSRSARTTRISVRRPCELAARLSEVVPCAERVRFFNSGTESWTSRCGGPRADRPRRILKLEGGFHGGNDATLFNTNFGERRLGPRRPPHRRIRPGLPAAAASSLVLAPYDDAAARAHRARASRTSSRRSSSSPSSGGSRPGPASSKGCAPWPMRSRVPLVFDEVITGFRLALGGAQEFYGVAPDLAVLGKGLGSGFPIGVLVGSEAAMEPLDPKAPDAQRIVAEGSTLANPISATAALATLEILSRPGTYEHLHGWGDGAGEGLRDAFARQGRTIQLTGVGPIVEFFVSDGRSTDYLAAMRTDLAPKARLAGGLRGPRRLRRRWAVQRLAGARRCRARADAQRRGGRARIAPRRICGRTTIHLTDRTR